jgi:hypothetical protein
LALLVTLCSSIFSALGRFSAKYLIGLVSAAGMPSATIFNDLDCQTDLKAHFGRQGVFPALSNLIVQREDGSWSIGGHDDAAEPFPTRHFAEAIALAGTATHSAVSP